MLKKINKRFLYVLLAAFILMILGLIFIGAGHIKTSEFSVTMNGFDADRIYGIGQVLASEMLRSSLQSTSGLDLIRCGIVFAVIFTPILFTVGITGSIYDFITLIKNKETIEDKQEQIVVNQE